jgi:hypothetical protein
MTDLVPTDVPIVGHPDEIAMVLRTAAHRGNLLTDPRRITPRRLADGRHAVKVRMLMPRQPVRARARRWFATHEVAGAMVKAFAFVMTLAAIGVALLAVTVALARNALAGVDWTPLIGAAAAAATLLLAVNRARHSGTCPGIAVHCKGCKH